MEQGFKFTTRRKAAEKSKKTRSKVFVEQQKDSLARNKDNNMGQQGNKEKKDNSRVSAAENTPKGAT